MSFLSGLVPGLGIVKGMSLTLRRFFEPKVTVMYPEVRLDVPHKFRGRLQLLYDEWGTLKCETCFQCAQACPIECIDMGGIDTRGRYHVHWGAPETYGERREESALRRSGRPVPDPAYRAVRAGRPLGRRCDPRGARPRSRPDALDPRGDPGGVRLPARGRAQAHQPPHRRLVRDDLRHGHLLRAPALRATGRDRAGGRGRRPSAARGRLRGRPGERPRPTIGWHRPSAGARRRATDRGRPPQDPGRVADDPVGARGRQRPDRPRRGRPGRRIRRTDDGRPRSRADRDHRRDRGVRAARARRGGLSRRPRSGGPRPRATSRAGSSSRTATARTRRPARTGTCSSADPFAIIEGAAIVAFAIGAAEAIIAVRAEDTEAIRRLEAAIGAAEEAGYIGAGRLRAADRPDRHRPTGPGRLHAGRGDRAAEGPRGQARPARTAAAPPRRARPVRRPDRRPQRPDPGRRRLDHPQRRGRLREDRLEDEPGHGAGPGPDAVGRRDRGGPAGDAPAQGRRARWGPAGRPVDQGGPGRRAVGRPPPRRGAGHARTTTSRSVPRAPTSARARSSSPTIGRASSTWRACSPGSVRARPAARRSRAGSARDGSWRSPTAPWTAARGPPTSSC